MVPRLFERLTEVGARLGAAPAWLVLLDFDGTLAPIAPTPDSVFLSPALRQLLRNLAHQPRVALGFISGRARADLQERIGLADVYYAGNHGLEICGPHRSFTEPTAVSQQDLLTALAADLTDRLQPIVGAWAENKGLTLSVHFRLVEADGVEEVRRCVHGDLAAANHPFVLTMGDKVFYIRPRTYWNKGSAVTWIREHADLPDAVVVYVGDDATDEDAFLALADAITIKVGPSAETAARYQVDGPPDVHKFLEWLSHLTRKRSF